MRQHLKITVYIVDFILIMKVIHFYCETFVKDRKAKHKEANRLLNARPHPQATCIRFSTFLSKLIYAFHVIKLM